MKDLMKTVIKGRYVNMVKDKVRAAFTFDPDDPDRLAQQPKARDGYRFPAPGSITGARVPIRVEDKDGKVDPFDVKAYTYDPRNLPAEDKVVVNSLTRPLTLEEDNWIKLGKPGAKDPAVLSYDPSGLRVPNTAGWEAFAVEAASHMPDHLVRCAWEENGGEEALNKECEEKGLPYMIGKRFKWNNVNKSYNTYKW